MFRTSLLFLLGLLLLPACGGGGTSGTPTLPTAQVLGVVMTRDGTSADLDGIEVTCDATGDKDWTDTDGSFRLDAPAGQTFRIRFREQAGSQSVSEDIDEVDDDTPDDQDIDGDEVEIAALDVDDVCEIEIEIEAGEIIEVWIRRSHRDSSGQDGDDEDGEARLSPPDGVVEDGPRGEIELESEDGIVELEVEVEGLDGPATYGMELWHPDGDEMSLGDIEVDADGVGRADLEWGEGDVLPFDAETVGDLAGVEFVILDDTGTVVLRGKLPGQGADHDDRERPRAAWDLVVPENGPEPEAEGEMLLKFDDDHLRVVIEVSHVFSTDALDVVLVPAEGDEIELGTMEIDELGMGRLVLEFGEDDDVPEISFSPSDVIGLTIELRNADGAAVLVGEMPDIDFPSEFPHDPPTAGDAALLPPDGSAEADARGKVLVVAFGDRGALVIVAEGFSAAMTLDVILTSDGTDEALGQMEIGKEGCGRFGLETNADSTLPFEATSLADLAGYTLSLADADGNVLLEGTMPEVTTFSGKWHGGDDD